MRQCEQACLRSGWPYGGTRGWAACREAETRPGRDSAFRHYSGLRSGRGDTTGEFLGVAFSDAAPPNGEDLLYVFRARVEGRSLLLPYNIMRKAVATPLPCHGHALLDDGTLLVLRAGSDQAARVHPIQRWHPPYVADSYVAARPVGASAPALIGNAELVRGISNCRPVARLVADKTAPTTGVYETLLAAFARATDQHHWRDRAEVGDPLRPLVRRQGSGSWLSGGDGLNGVVANRARQSSSSRASTGSRWRKQPAIFAARAAVTSLRSWRIRCPRRPRHRIWLPDGGKSGRGAEPGSVHREAGARHQLVFVDRLVSTLIRLRHDLPHAVMGVLFGGDRSTVTRAVAEVRQLPAERGFAVPDQPGLRPRTLEDVFS
ncbi:hypothetical protein DWB77_00426 [Streptomyces hundungensis]|uniref:Transposase Helix-turn-helix domain-containing protein n=1 Tax=Streptomyces hundungensis TaxID=1077946 RepID=A0A387H528_9ACTN|nr:hypothetical protein DWB77_00426 [Streptomyces hundungensis]